MTSIKVFNELLNIGTGSRFTAENRTDGRQIKKRENHQSCILLTSIFIHHFSERSSNDPN